MKKKKKITPKQKLKILKQVEIEEAKPEMIVVLKEEEPVFKPEDLILKENIKEILPELCEFLEGKNIVPPGVFKEEVWLRVFTEVMKFLLNEPEGIELAERLYKKEVSLTDLYEVDDCPECKKKLEFLNRSGVKIKKF